MSQCKRCLKLDDCRLGFCFDCASTGEQRLARRSVFQHIGTGIKHCWTRQWEYARFDFGYAWQRWTRTGAYADGGTWDQEGYNWRS